MKRRIKRTKHMNETELILRFCQHHEFEYSHELISWVCLQIATQCDNSATIVAHLQHIHSFFVHTQILFDFSVTLIFPFSNNPLFKTLKNVKKKKKKALRLNLVNSCPNFFISYQYIDMAKSLSLLTVMFVLKRLRITLLSTMRKCC